MREAIKNGADLVPVFCFGNSKLFKVVGESSKVSMGLMKRLSRRIKASILIFYGRLYLPIPIRHPLLFVVGKPMPVVQKADPSKEEIAAMHGTFLSFRSLPPSLPQFSWASVFVHPHSAPPVVCAWEAGAGHAEGGADKGGECGDA